MTAPHINKNRHITNSSTKNINKKPKNAGKKTNRKTNIPKKLREEVWNHYNKGKYDAKCYVPWCHRNIDVFNFHVGHDIPECKGGTTDIINLKPICASCNLSMSYKFTITDWSKLKLKQKNILDNLNLFNISYNMICFTSIMLNFYSLF